MARRVRDLLRGGMRRLGFDLRRYNAHMPELYSGDPDFLRLFDEIRRVAVISQEQAFALYQWIRHAGTLAGEAAEVGVFRGGTSRLLARACPGKTLHLFDTFSGMPPVDAEVDRVREGDFGTSLAEVRAFLGDCDNLVFHPGTFPETAAAVEDRSFCFVHLDVDIYGSTKAGLEFFLPRMVVGGVILVHDYEHPDCPGVRRALDEVLAGRSETPLITARYQCLLQKLDAGPVA